MRLFFHLPGSRPDKEEMKTHVTLPRASGRMDAQVVDVGEVEREFQAGHVASGATEHEYGEKSKNGPLQHSKRVGEREETQSSAKLERASRTLPHLCITIVFFGGTQTT